MVLKLSPPLERDFPLFPLDDRFLPTEEPVPRLLLFPEFERPLPTEDPLDRVPLRPTEPDELLPTELPVLLTLPVLTPLVRVTPLPRV